MKSHSLLIFGQRRYSFVVYLEYRQGTFNLKVLEAIKSNVR